MAARDVVVIPIVLFILGIIFFIAFFVAHTMITNVVAIPAIASSPKAVEAFQATETAAARFDMLFMSVFMGMAMSFFILSWFIPGHPIFTFFYLVFIIVGVILSAFIANVWEAISQRPDLVSTVASFPITNHILSRLPIYMAVIGCLGMILFFRKAVEGKRASGGVF